MSNPIPLRDGDVLTYRPRDVGLGPYSEPILRLRERGAASAARVNLIYINGMMTTTDTHRRTAEDLATMTNRPVIGIYNLTGNSSSDGSQPQFGSDFLQSVQDYLNPVGRGRVLAPYRHGLSAANGFTPTQYFATAAAGAISAVYRYATASGEDYINLLRQELSNNMAGTALLNLLLDHYWYQCGFRKTVIVAHSQGNLITANVVWCLLRAFAPKALPAPLKVIGVASPNPSWPANGERNFHWRTFNDRRDPVSWLANVPEVIGGAIVGGAASPLPGTSVVGAHAGFESSRNSGGSRDVRNSSSSRGPSLEAHDVERYLMTQEFIAELTADLT